jgi:hypothetical protein
VTTARTGTWLTLALVLACSPRKTSPVDRSVLLDSSPPATDRPATASVSPLQIIPGRSAGPVTAASREADLKLRYGAEAVRIERPARFILRGSRSKWTVGPGISLGTSLQELERINGRPFTLAGFGWDYAGVINEWRGGALDSALAGVKLYLDPGPAQYESAAYSQVLGDRDYSSSLPPMQQLNPRVAQIYVDFE